MRENCGPKCLKMICEYHNKNLSLHEITQLCKTDDKGTSIYNLIECAKYIGFSSFAIEIDPVLLNKIGTPALAFYPSNHFIVILEVNNTYIKIFEPFRGVTNVSYDKFISDWIDYSQSKEGIIIVVDNN